MSNLGTKEAPTTLRGILSNIGPGMILAGSIVGSGELIATTRTGAEAHFDFLWLIIIGCIVKVFAQIELGRHAITNGKTSLGALNEIPGPRFRIPIGRRVFNANWFLLFWSVMFVAVLAQQGGIVGGVGQALAISIPLTEEGAERNHYVSKKIAIELAQEENNLQKITALKEELQLLGNPPVAKDDIYWALIITFLTILLLIIGKFSLIERFSILLVASFTFITIINLFALQSYESWAIKPEEIIRGLSFSFPEIKNGNNPLITAISTFGIIGVGAAELLAYPYWCIEKGYGKHVGPCEDNEAWLIRAKGWMKVMHWDAWGAMVVYTFCTIAFYLLGAAVLGRTGLLPEGSEMIQTLSTMYEPVFGSLARSIFLTGAIAVLFSTFFIAIAAQGRLCLDVIKVSGFAKLTDKQNAIGLKIFGVTLPLICVMCYVFFPKPVILVLVSGTMQAIMLPLIGFAVLYFRYQKCDSRLIPNKIWDICLWLSFFGFLIAGAYQVYAKILSN
jgi:Mn2+/Fe2+ NRAMP family transporter